MVSIVCPKCGFALEATDDRTLTYDVERWAKMCEQPDNGTPLLCEKIKATIALHGVKTDSNTRGPLQ